MSNSLSAGADQIGVLLLRSLHVGSQVRMSAAWRLGRMSKMVLARGERGFWYSSYGPMWRDFEGRIEQIYTRRSNVCAARCSRCASLPQTEVIAVVIHEPVDCGCTPHRGKVCGRCENTYVATRSYINVDDLEHSMTDSEKCPSCDRDVMSIIPVPEGGMTVCAGCLAVMIMESGQLRVASEQEAEGQVAQRKVTMAKFLRRLCPPGDVQ